jgi:hypothetical protein
MSTIKYSSKHNVMFFYNFLQRNNIVLNREIDILFSFYQNVIKDECLQGELGMLSSRDVNEQDIISYFKVFVGFYALHVNLFWFICVLYYSSLATLRRYFTYLQVETKRAAPSFYIIPYDDVCKMDKPTVLRHLYEFICDDEEKVHMVLNSMLNFF